MILDPEVLLWVIDERTELITLPDYSGRTLELFTKKGGRFKDTNRLPIASIAG